MARRKLDALMWAAAAALGTMGLSRPQSAFAFQNGVDPTTAPTTQVAPATQAADDATPMKVIVAAVDGRVQVRKSSNDQWVAATVGMELTEGAEFRTGMRSSVRCQIPPDQEFIIDRLTTTRVSEAIKQGGVIKTDLSMKYGRTQYSIQAAGAQHEATIRSPSSTLAVRGTVVSLYDQPPFTPEAKSYVGRAVYRDAKKEVAVGSPSRGGRILANRSDAADTALSQTVVDPVYAAARTNSEAQFIAQETSRGGIVSFDQRAGIDVVRNSIPFSDAELNPLSVALPGDLNFILRWSGNADLNLGVSNQVGNANTILGIPSPPNFDPVPPEKIGFKPTDVVYPGFGLDRNTNGGRILFDNRGGPNGGQEIAFWTVAPQGAYGIQATHVSGEQARLKFNVFLGGVAQPIDAPKAEANGIEPGVRAGVIRFNDSTKNFVYTKTTFDFTTGQVFGTEENFPVLEGERSLVDANGNQVLNRFGQPLFNDTYDPDLNPGVFDPTFNPTGEVIPIPTQIERTLNTNESTTFNFFIFPPADTEPMTAAQRKAREKAQEAAAKAQRVAAKREAEATKKAAAQARVAERKAQDVAAQAAKRQKALDAKAAKEVKATQQTLGGKR